MSKRKGDYFIAKIEDKALSLKPYCGTCEIQLNEDYYCENCRHQCLCTHVKCEDNESYNLMYTLIKKNTRFHKFTIEMLKKNPIE
ncbi:MAG: hypothetical protein SWO11_01530 [Thermodesulfobacteriota bacterium]|nr:hypothetical protein [Thermodesulfobacteriota bacterium]